MLKTFEPEIEELSLLPSDGGRFEIVVNGELLYSKLETRRHIPPEEAIALIRQYLSENPS